ncbi:MAG: hypothetical protein WC483_06615, partial [Candidatus Paceibacterota bacterium]
RGSGKGRELTQDHEKVVWSGMYYECVKIAARRYYKRLYPNLAATFVISIADPGTRLKIKLLPDGLIVRQGGAA